MLIAKSPTSFFSDTVRALIWVALAAGCSSAPATRPVAENPAQTKAVIAPPRSLARTGTVARAVFDRALAAGPGAMFADVHVEPHFADGDFAGWRIHWIDPAAGLADIDIRAGDITTAVNGHSLERPSDLHEVWTALATDDEVIVDVERDGVPFQLRFKIVDAP